MRKELEEIKRIDDYLNGELSIMDLVAFQEELNSSSRLQKEVEKQELLLGGLQSFILKKSAKKAFIQYKIFTFLKYFVFSSIVVVSGVLFWNVILEDPDVSNPKPKSLDSIPSLIDVNPVLEKNIEAERDSLKYKDKTVEADRIEPVSNITIEAEDYVDYNDLSPDNLGGEYRNDAVDIYDLKGRIVVGHTFPNEWMEYSFDINTSGRYEVLMTVGSGQDSVKREIALSVNSILLGIAEVPYTTAWLKYTEISAATIKLDKAPRQKLRLDFKTGWINLDKITLRYIGQ